LVRKPLKRQISFSSLLEPEVEAPSSVSAGSLPSASPVVDFSAPPEMAKVGA
jgi:hypothetical protein